VSANQSVRTQRDVVTLLEALPYIREFHGRTVVVKYGGAAMTDPALKQEFARDIALLKYVGVNPVIVHGGGPEITSYMERLNIPVQFVEGLRVSDEATVELAKMVLVGKVNTDIVSSINRHGQPAVGLSGDDGQLFRCSRLASPSGQDIGFVGRIDHVNTGVLTHVGTDYIPVVASVGADEQGRSYNINADDAAAAVAQALRAYKVMFLTDVAGWPGVGGGMRPKLSACVDAVQGGVSSAVIVDGRVPHSLLLELFTNDGQGTMILPDGGSS
jgi:acetylglutamate kinase